MVFRDLFSENETGIMVFKFHWMAGNANPHEVTVSMPVALNLRRASTAVFARSVRGGGQVKRRVVGVLKLGDRKPEKLIIRISVSSHCGFIGRKNALSCAIENPYRLGVVSEEIAILRLTFPKRGLNGFSFRAELEDSLAEVASNESNNNN